MNSISAIPLGDSLTTDLLVYIVDKAVEHRPWFNDLQWNNEEMKRRIAINYISDALLKGRIWGAWRKSEILGILLLNDINFGMSASCHFIFFDHELRNKRELCLSLMKMVFQDPGVMPHSLRVELPAFSHRLSSFLRKTLGFRYENERTEKSLSAAKRTSRKHQAILWNGTWHDVLLLSVTRDEFAAFLEAKENVRTKNGATPPVESGSATRTSNLRLPPTDLGRSRESPTESPEHSGELRGTTIRPTVSVGTNARTTNQSQPSDRSTTDF